MKRYRYTFQYAFHFVIYVLPYFAVSFNCGFDLKSRQGNSVSTWQKNLRHDSIGQSYLLDRIYELPLNVLSYKNVIVEIDDVKKIRNQVCSRQRSKGKSKETPHTRRWFQNLDNLVNFKKEHGHCNVPINYAINKKLGRWVSSQRTLYRLKSEGKRTTLNEVRIELLENEGFIWDMFLLAWTEKLNQLRSFHCQHGHCLVPVGGTGDDKIFRELGFWVEVQRQSYTKYLKGLPSNLTKERVTLLDEIGFIWDVKKSAWETRLLQLRQFKHEHGHCNVPNNLQFSSLTSWVATQRRDYRKNASGIPTLLTNNRVRLLLKEGFIFNPHDAAWEQQYQDLVQYKIKNGNCNVPRTGSHAVLGRWVRWQRNQNCRKWKSQTTTLTNERYQALMALEFNWYIRPIKLTINERYRELQQYISFYGDDCRIPIHCNTNPGLPQWVQQQKDHLTSIPEGKESLQNHKLFSMLNNLHLNFDQ